MIRGATWVTAAMGALALSGCQKAADTPEQICSSPKTYDQIVQMLSGQVGSAMATMDFGAAQDLVSAASSNTALARVVSFKMPTVADMNKDTKRVSCEAIMQLAAPAGVQSTIPKTGLEVNEVAADHIQIRIKYSLQPSADGGQNVLTLEGATDLAVAAEVASLGAVQRMRNAAGTAPPPDEAESFNDADYAPEEQVQPQETPTPEPVPSSMPDETPAPAGGDSLANGT